MRLDAGKMYLKTIVSTVPLIFIIDATIKKIQKLDQLYNNWWIFKTYLFSIKNVEKETVYKVFVWDNSFQNTPTLIFKNFRNKNSLIHRKEIT